MGHFGSSEGGITISHSQNQKNHLRIQAKKAIISGESPQSLVSTHNECGIWKEALPASSVLKIKMKFECSEDTLRELM